MEKTVEVFCSDESGALPSKYQQQCQNEVHVHVSSQTEESALGCVGRMHIGTFKNDPEGAQLYTGLESYQMFKNVLSSRP